VEKCTPAGEACKADGLPKLGSPSVSL